MKRRRTPKALLARLRWVRRRALRASLGRLPSPRAGQPSKGRTEVPFDW